MTRTRPRRIRPSPASAVAVLITAALLLVSLTPPAVVRCEATPDRTRPGGGRGGGYHGGGGGDYWKEEDRDAGAYFHAMVEGGVGTAAPADGGDYYFDDDYPASGEEEAYPQRPSWFGNNNDYNKDDEDEGGRPPLPSSGFGGGGGRPPRPPPSSSFQPVDASICPVRPSVNDDNNTDGGRGGGRLPIATPSDGAVVVARLPGLMADFAFNPRTGDVAGVDPIADRAYLFRRGDLEAGGANDFTSEIKFTGVDVGRTPVDVVYKQYGNDGYYAVVCRHDPHLYVINATDFKLVKKAALSPSSGMGVSAVASSSDPEDPFLYYGTRRGQHGPPRGGPDRYRRHFREEEWGGGEGATLAAFDIRTMTDRGVVKILEEEWEWDYEEEWDRDEEWGWGHPPDAPHKPDGGRGGGGGGRGRSPFELAVSADGNVVYTRSSPHGSTIAHRRRSLIEEEALAEWNATAATNDDVPRFVEGDVSRLRRSELSRGGGRDSRDGAIAFVHPGPFGEVVGLGPSIYSSDLTTELAELDFVPGCFFHNRSLIVGYVDSRAEHGHRGDEFSMFGHNYTLAEDRPDVLMAASYNTFDPLGRPLSIAMPDPEDDQYSEYGARSKQENYELRVSMCVDGLEEGKRLRLRRRLFADDGRGTVVVAHGDDVALIPLDELRAPQEPFLRLEFDPTSGGHLVAGGLLEVVPLRASDPSVGVSFDDGQLPRGASYDADRGFLSWEPSLDQIGTHFIEATLRHEGGGAIVERVVPLTINVSLPFIELPFVDGGRPLVDGRGRFVVVWSNDDEDEDHHGRDDDDYHYYSHKKQDYYRVGESSPQDSRVAILPTAKSTLSPMQKVGLPRIDRVLLSDDLVIIVHRRQDDRASAGTTVSFYDVETFELVKSVVFGGGRPMDFEMCSDHELLATSGYDYRRPRPPHYYGPEEVWMEEIFYAMNGESGAGGGGYPHELYDLRDFSMRRFRGRDEVDCDARVRDEPMVDGVVRRGVLHDWSDGGGPLLVLDSSRFPAVAMNRTGGGGGYVGGFRPPRSWLPGPNVPCSADDRSEYETAWMKGGRMCVQLETRTDHADDDGTATVFKALLRVFSIDGSLIANPTVIRKTCPKTESSSHYGRRDGLCHVDRYSKKRPKLLVAGTDVYVVLGREITVWSGADSLLTTPPGAVTIEPRSLPSTTVKTRYFRLVPRQSEFLIESSDGQVSLRHEATGGTPPYEYFHESNLLLANNRTRQGEVVRHTDQQTGTTVIDGVKLKEVGVDTLIEYHRMHGRAQLRALSLKTVEPWMDTFGTKPLGIPVGLPLHIRAVDSKGLTTDMVYYVYTHVPYSDVVSAIERDEATSRSSAWNGTVTGGWGLSSILLVAVAVLAAVVITCLSILVVRLNRRVATLSSVRQDGTQIEPLHKATAPPLSPQVNKAILIDDASSSTDCASARDEN